MIVARRGTIAHAVKKYATGVQSNPLTALNTTTPMERNPSSTTVNAIIPIA